MPKLAFTFVDEKVATLVDLHQDLAPATCKTIWDACARPIRAAVLRSWRYC